MSHRSSFVRASKFWLVVLLLLPVFGLGVRGARAQACAGVSDNFAVTGGLNPSNWTQLSPGSGGYGPLVQTAGMVQPSSKSGQGLALWTGTSFTPDQCSQVVVTAKLQGVTGPVVLMDATGSGYFWFVSTLHTIYKLQNGAGAGGTGASCPIPAVGDTIRLTYTSATHTVTCADLTQGTAASIVDYTYNSGSPGILVDRRTASWKDSLGSFGAASTGQIAQTPPPVVIPVPPVVSKPVPPVVTPTAPATTPVVSGGLVAAPTTVPAGATGYSIALTGSNTKWASGTSPFSLSGGSGASITRQVVNSATSATILVSGGSTNGALTIADSTSGSTTTVTVRGPATWYVRNDGGPRSRCTGMVDAPDTGSGTAQPCAFNDYRYLWDDQSYKNNGWLIGGGDTVILRGGPWRVGWDANSGPGAGYTWCFGADNIGCFNPTVPSGTPTQHTRILGENFANCSATNKTQIFGGFGVITPMNLSGAVNVDVQCLEITRHSSCMAFGSPAVPGTCKSGGPVDDYDSDGIHTNETTANLNLTDLWIHGHVGRGIKGPIGGVVTCLRCTIAYNGAAGWDFDDGNATPLPTSAVWNFNYSTIEFSGCNQEYPIVSALPALSCYSQSTGGYGDGVGTPAGTGLSVNIDHSVFRYNTQDGVDLGHVDTGNFTLNITNSIAYGNGGGQMKWGGNFYTANFLNNLVAANCMRMKSPLPGTPSTYNANLGDFCRATDALPFNLRDGAKVLFANNTIVTYTPTTFDIDCWTDASSTGGVSCPNSVLTFRDNIVRGYDNPDMYAMGGQRGGPGLFYFQHPIATIVRDHNLFYGMRNTTCPTAYASELCVDPMLVGEPPVWTNDAALDIYSSNLTNWALSPGSPARAVGVLVTGAGLDLSGILRGSQPDLGALQSVAGAVLK